MQNIEQYYTLILLIGGLFALFLTILWTLLPFAVFGIKKRLDELIAQNDQLYHQLSILNSRLPMKLETEDMSDISRIDKSMEIACDKCGHINWIGSEKCENCGADLKKEPMV